MLEYKRLFLTCAHFCRALLNPTTGELTILDVRLRDEDYYYFRFYVSGEEEQGAQHQIMLEVSSECAEQRAKQTGQPKKSVQARKKNRGISHAIVRVKKQNAKEGKRLRLPHVPSSLCFKALGGKIEIFLAVTVTVVVVLGIIICVLVLYKRSVPTCPDVNFCTEGPKNFCGGLHSNVVHFLQGEEISEAL